MTEHRNNKSEHDIDALRASYSALPKSAPDDAVDARIRDAARRHRKRLSPVWLGAIGTAACIGLAVVLVPALLVQVPHERARAPAGELVVSQAEPAAPAKRMNEDVDAPALPATVAPAPPQSSARESGPALDQSVTLARENEAARAKMREQQRRELRAPTDTAAGFSDRQTQEENVLERVEVTGSRLARVDPEGAATLAFLNEVRAGLAGADEAAWREQILTLRSGGDDRLAQALLADFRIRFDRPETFTLDDLAHEEAAANRDNR